MPAGRHAAPGNGFPIYPVAAFLVVVLAVTGEVVVWAHRHDRTPHAVTRQTNSQPFLTADLTPATPRHTGHTRPL